MQHFDSLHVSDFIRKAMQMTTTKPNNNNEPTTMSNTDPKSSVGRDANVHIQKINGRSQIIVLKVRDACPMLLLNW